MKRKIIIISIVFAYLSFSNVYIAGAEAQSSVADITAPSAILMEVNRGQVLFEKNSDMKLHISSASKIMTAVLALEKIKPETKVTVSKEAVSIKGSILNLEAGDKYLASDLITAIILTPANDAASALAEFAAGDIESFVSMMNQKAKEINMINTKFCNPTGLFDEQQYTTADDLSKLIQYALKNPEFNKIFSVKGKPFNSQILVNHNKLFWSYEGIDGGKAGYNERDKQSAVTTVTRGKLRVCAIVLDSPRENIWEDSKSLLDYGFNNYRTGILVNRDQILKNIPVNDKEIGLLSLEDIYYTYPVGESFVNKIEFVLPEEIKPPVSKKVSIGEAVYILKDGTKIGIPLYANIEIEETKSVTEYIISKFVEVKGMTYLIIALLFIELIIGVYKLVKYLRGKVSKSHNYRKL